MRHSIVIAIMLTAGAGLLSVPANDAWAARKKGHAAAVHAPKAGKAKRARTGSDESAAERDRRLRRECKSLPNAGACLGYAN